MRPVRDMHVEFIFPASVRFPYEVFFAPPNDVDTAEYFVTEPMDRPQRFVISGIDDGDDPPVPTLAIG